MNISHHIGPAAGIIPAIFSPLCCRMSWSLTCAPCVHRVSHLNIDAVLVCNWSQPPTRDGAAGEPDPGLWQTITSISDLTDFQGKEGGAPLLIRLSHNDVRNEEIFLEPSIFKRHDDECGDLF